jgi:hypothetical protein
MCQLWNDGVIFVECFMKNIKSVTNRWSKSSLLIMRKLFVTVIVIKILSLGVFGQKTISEQHADTFTYSNNNNSRILDTIICNSNNDPNEIFINAKFQNGDINDFRIYITKSLIISDTIKLNSAKRVIVQFDVNCKGKLENIRFLRSYENENIINAIYKMLENSPRWTPAFNKEHLPVGQTFIIPISLKK